MTADRIRTERAWFRRLMPLPALAVDAPRPASSPAEAIARFDDLAALDSAIPQATRSALMEPEGPAVATVVLWHGFTNAPSQFAAVGEELRSHGYRVLLPRMPHHGQADLLNRDLARLTAHELVQHVDAVIDIATGFGDPVWVLGLSGGACLAAWAAARRSEVTRLAMFAPLVAPTGFPLPLVRAFVRFPWIVPRFYYWWDPRKKADLGHSPYAYPGFPVPGLMPFLRLSEALFDLSVAAGHQLERVVVLTNPGDFAIRSGPALAFTSAVFGAHTDCLGHAGVDGGLKWMHDFVDPWSPDTGTPAQVAAIVLACFGTGEPTAGGLLVPPLVIEQPA